MLSGDAFRGCFPGVASGEVLGVGVISGGDRRRSGVLVAKIFTKILSPPYDSSTIGALRPAQWPKLAVSAIWLPNVAAPSHSSNYERPSACSKSQ
jgi:hypothetical protein